MEENYYEVLEVTRTATAKEIKMAYRKKMAKFHPDINKAKDAERIAKLLNRAYAILGDAEKRADYDFQLSFNTVKIDYKKSYETPQEFWDDISDLYKEAQRQQEDLRVHGKPWTYRGKPRKKARKVRVQTSEGYYDIEFKP